VASDNRTLPLCPFDLVNVIMANTMLPRLAIIRIIKGLSAEARNKINNQDYLEEAIKTINKLLKEFKSKEFLTAELIESVGALEKDIFEVDKIVNEDEIKYLFTPNPAHKKAMNLKYKFDSEGEWKFAKALDDDPNVMLYTKLKKAVLFLKLRRVITRPTGRLSIRRTTRTLLCILSQKQNGIRTAFIPQLGT
jgi:type III restriction enzyme